MKYKNMKTKFLFVITVAIFCFTLQLQAQDDGGLGEQTLIIYNEYTPVLKDANRMQFLPVIVDTIKIRPKFEYKVVPQIYKTEFNPTPITAASLKGEPLKPLDNGMIKIGVGNYLSPLVDVYYNSRRQKDFSVGAIVNHHSAHGTIKNIADQKIFAGYNNNNVLAYGKKFLRNSTLSGDLGFKSNQMHFYGYDPYITLPGDVAKPRDRAEMETQRYMRLNTDIGLSSNNQSPNSIDYEMYLKYQYFFTMTEDYQHKVEVLADINKKRKNTQYGIDAGFDFHKNKIGIFENNEMYLMLDPYLKHFTKDWQILLGVNTTGELGGDSLIYHFYPNIMIQHNISNVIIPYASFSGYIQDNDFEKSSIINPFINRFNNYQITNYAQVIDVGIKGNISKNLYVHVNGNYSKIDNMGFFVNDTSQMLNNKFLLEYTNVERFAGYGEFALREMGKFSFNLKGHYYYYSYIKNRELPWHMPSVDVCLKTNYQFDSKLNFGIDVDFVGKRHAKEYLAVGGYNEKELDPIVDVSLFGEYKFASNFHAWLYLNNLAGQKHYVWNNYMSQGFNVMLGIKYLF